MRKVKLSVYLKPDVYNALRARAQAHGLSPGRTATLLVEQGLEEERDGVATLFLPSVEAIVRREVARAANRLAHLLARSAVEASTTRRVAYRQLLRQGWTEDEVRHLHNEVWYRSVESLKQPMAEIAEIVRAAGFSPLGSEDGSR